MSEYQFVAFRAIDKPVSEKNLKYMERQSSRAEITAWSFENEYNYSDFRGNALEMLRRGYDIHLHYANFGIRKLLIRSPNGLPDKKIADAFFGEDSLQFIKDKQGPGGTLSVQPFYEPDDLDELFDIEDLIDRLVPLRAEILAGDLRPLYLAHLAISCDSYHDREETKEAPVPAGLGKLTDAQLALADLFSLSEALITAASRGTAPLEKQDDPRNQHTQWIQQQPQAIKDAWLARLLSDPDSTVKAEILTAFQKGSTMRAWPTVRKDRTIGELEAAAVEIQEKANLKSAKKAADQRAKKLASMAADPAKTLRETDELVKNCSTDSYAKIAKLLSELRESLAGTAQSGLAEQQARKLKNENPTLRVLTSELRREGFVPK